MSSTNVNPSETNASYRNFNGVKFGTDFAASATATASSVGAQTSAANVIDCDLGTIWRSDGLSSQGEWLELDLGGANKINTERLSQPGSSDIRYYAIQVWD